MIKTTGTNGIRRVEQDNVTATAEQNAAKIDYIAMMCGVDIPTEEAEDFGEVRNSEEMVW